MVNLPDLVDERAHLLKSCRDLTDKTKAEKRSLTAEERKEFDELKKQIEGLDAQIRDANETLEREKWYTERDAELRQQRPERKTSPHPCVEAARNDDLREFDARFRSYGERRAFTARNFGVSDQESKEYAYRAGMWLRACFWGDRKAQRWCNDRGLEYRALATTTNAAGGSLVPPDELAQAIIQNREQYGFIRQEARVWPMGQDTLRVPRQTANVTGYWVGEAGAITESSPTFDTVGLTAKKVGCLTKYSTEIAEDAIINIADLLADEFAWTFAYTEDNAAVNGDGTTTYGGVQGLVSIFITPSQLAGGVDATSGTDSLSEIAIADFTDILLPACPGYARPNGKFFMSQAAFDAVVLALAAAGGGHTFATLAGPMEHRLFGYPVVISQHMPASMTAATYNNKVMLLFGDMRRAVQFGDRRDIRLMVSDHRYFENDQIAIKATERIDINVSDVGDTSTAGPLVALIGQT
jgi:HK97 family phage major capsid protein